MAKFRLDADAVVEDAYYTVDVKLIRKVKNEYGTGDLATATFKVPLDQEGLGGVLLTDALLAIRNTFETAFGPVTPVTPAVGVTLSDEDGDAALKVDMPF